MEKKGSTRCGVRFLFLSIVTVLPRHGLPSTADHSLEFTPELITGVRVLCPQRQDSESSPHNVYLRLPDAVCNSYLQARVLVFGQIKVDGHIHVFGCNAMRKSIT